MQTNLQENVYRGLRPFSPSGKKQLFTLKNTHLKKIVQCSIRWSIATQTYPALVIFGTFLELSTGARRTVPPNFIL